MNDLFLCHTGTDKDWTRSLGERLEQEKIQHRPVKVFFDEWDIDYGTNLIDEIDKGLKESRYVGLVLSPAMLRAAWPAAEWQSQVVDDPAGRRGRVLPLLLHKFDPASGAPIELPFVLKGLKRFDFSQSKRFDQEYERLLRKLADLPPTRGRKHHGLGSALHAPSTGPEAPDHIEEALPSNLLPLLTLPKWLYTGPTTVTDKGDVWAKVKGTTPPFFFHGDRLVSFVPHTAKDNVFKPFLKKTDRHSELTTKWLADPDGARQVVGLLNTGFREHCYHLGIRTPKSNRNQFYCPIFKEAEPRLFSWGRGRARTLAILKERQNAQHFGVHMSAYVRFIMLGSRLFLLVEPGWLFTTDGVKPLEGKDVGVLSTKWGGRERNAAVLRNVLMWGLLFATGKKTLDVNLATKGSPEYVTVQSVPSHTKINAGIAADSIRLDRILSGDGAGEVREAVLADGQTLTVEGERELSDVADLALFGESDEEAESDADRRSASEEQDSGPDELSLSF